MISIDRRFALRISPSAGPNNTLYDNTDKVTSGIIFLYLKMKIYFNLYHLIFKLMNLGMLAIKF